MTPYVYKVSGWWPAREDAPKFNGTHVYYFVQANTIERAIAAVLAAHPGVRIESCTWEGGRRLLIVDEATR